ncbi:MAG TPA: glycoside hydrolase family 3 C-terminal domain-containing protein [Candidatus Mediterraneibacter cottocaccae]|nr:glycoside hydrolase family 3 C-terminal domain-containing protein [Candidatus Mediterraneibacter cottocaccae]
MEKENIRKLVSELTLEEKAVLTSGRDNWFTKAVERLGIPSVRTSDGPNGLRTQEGEVNGLSEELSREAVCFPTSCTTAASFDTGLMEEIGHELGKESQAFGVNVLLGPGVNMKRSPLCGRNFEYFSEDPYLAGKLGAAYVKGVQSEGVGTGMKHFFANSQEHRRMDSSSEMDERTMREIYLTAFETIVKEAKPWTIMASYNKIDGVHATQNRKYLTDVLRGEWGFEGLVMSDWGATHDRAAAVLAGCDLTMPAENTDQALVKAVEEGTITEADLDACCVRILELAFRAAENQKKDVAFDYEGGHALARKAAEESMVLLKNEDHLLPLSPAKKTAFIGAFSESPRYQGGGSSHVTSRTVTDALTAAKQEKLDVIYAPGYDLRTGETTDELIREAKAAAAAADAAVVFTGLPESMESEGVDRRHMHMPEGHNRLIREVCSENPNTVVVLHHGSPVEMPWISGPKAVLDAYLGGEAVGEAVVNILYGKVNPSGHLAETFPLRLEDNPSYLSYFGENGKVNYREGVFIGYRYYTTKKQSVLFPFGHGLSYTTFEYSDLHLNKDAMKSGDFLEVRVKVKNTGDRAGKAVVQLYVSPEHVEMIRPVRELKGFRKVYLEPGEEKEIAFHLPPRAFQYWSEQIHDWWTEKGTFRIQICENAEKVLLEKAVEMDAEPLPPEGGYTTGTPMGEFVKTTKGCQFIDENIKYMVMGMAQAGFIPPEAMEMLEKIPGGINLNVIRMMGQRMNADATGNDSVNTLMSQSLGILCNFLPSEKKEELDGLIAELNGQK